MTETRKLNRDDLRSLCIRKDWYTKGTCDEYAQMLDMADGLETVGTHDIVDIAENILQHSETDYPITAVCFEIAEICHSFFE